MCECSELTCTAVSLWLVPQGALVGLRLALGEARGGGLRGRDDGGGAGQAQVAPVMVKALHLSFTGIWDGLTFINVWWREREAKKERERDAKKERERGK